MMWRAGFYYLTSRYYDPTVGRFVNADEQINDYNNLGLNLYAYCYNNPVNMVDHDGREPITFSMFLVGVLVFAVFITFTAYTAYVISIIRSPRFQRNWSRMCASIGSSISRSLSALGGSIRWAASSLSRKAKIVFNSILESFARVKTIPQYKSRFEKHHIVAKKAPNAELAKGVLEDVGIGINSDENLIWIKTGLHRRLHTNQYYGWANSVVISAYNSANGNSAKQKTNVLVALNIIRNALKTMSDASPF